MDGEHVAVRSQSERAVEIGYLSCMSWRRVLFCVVASSIGCGAAVSLEHLDGGAGNAGESSGGSTSGAASSGASSSGNGSSGTSSGSTSSGSSGGVRDAGPSDAPTLDASRCSAPTTTVEATADGGCLGIYERVCSVVPQSARCSCPAARCTCYRYEGPGQTFRYNGCSTTATQCQDGLAAAYTQCYP